MAYLGVDSAVLAVERGEVLDVDIHARTRCRAEWSLRTRERGHV
jgi:hypothetical protein